MVITNRAGSIGWDGDFYTSEDLHSIYGELISRQLLEASGLIARDGPITIVEMGPGARNGVPGCSCVSGA